MHGRIAYTGDREKKLSPISPNTENVVTHLLSGNLFRDTLLGNPRFRKGSSTKLPGGGVPIDTPTKQGKSLSNT